MTFHYTLPFVVLDVSTGALVPNRTDGVLIDDAGVAQPTTTPAGIPSQVVTGPNGVTAPFNAEIPYGRVRFGAVEAAVFSNENLGALQQATVAAAAAQAAADSVAGIAATATQIRYVGTDPDGRIWVSNTPVLNGGLLVIDAADRVYAIFSG